MRIGKILIIDNMSDKITGRYFCSILMESIGLLNGQRFRRKIWVDEIDLSSCIDFELEFHMSTLCLDGNLDGILDEVYEEYFEHVIFLVNRKGITTRKPLEIAEIYELPRIVIQDSLYNSFNKKIFLIDTFRHFPVKLENAIEIYKSIMNANRYFIRGLRYY